MTCFTRKLAPKVFVCLASPKLCRLIVDETSEEDAAVLLSIQDCVDVASIQLDADQAEWLGEHLIDVARALRENLGNA